MPEDRSSRADSALVAWIGAPPPSALAAALPANSRLHLGLTPKADLLVVRADVGPEVLRQLPLQPTHPPILATTEHDPSTADRMAWIKAGAEDLVSVGALPAAIARRLRRLARERSTDAAQAPAPLPSAQPSTPQPVDVRAVAVGSPDPAPPHRPAPSARPTDEFPALRVPQSPGGVDPAVRPWVDNLVAYLDHRDALIGPWRGGRIDAMLAMVHQRERLAAGATAADGHTSLRSTYGAPPATGSQGLDWPALVRRGPGRGQGGIEVDTGRVITVGTDGLTLRLERPVGSRQKMVLDLCADREHNAQLLVQARWQRRLSHASWVVGVLVLELRLRTVDPAL